MPRPTDTPDQPADYWSESRRPLTSLAFVAPLLIVYEAGVLALGPQAARNGADVWLRRFLETLDFGHYFLLPALVVSLLLAWHYTTREPWRVSRRVLTWMVVECAGLAVCLRLILQVEAVFLRAIGGWIVASVPLDLSTGFANLIGYLGAGVYEELLFRLILLSLAAWLLRGAGLDRRQSAVAAAVLTSLAFAAAHYVGPYGDPIEPAKFLFWLALVFRFVAGLFFSALFVGRGFGVAAGAHAGYDILARLW